MTVDVFWLIGIGATVAEVLGIITAFHAVMHARTAQGATAWVISLVTMPFVSLPLYWIFGRSKFQGYVKARQQRGRQGRRVPGEVQRAVQLSRSL